MDECDRLALGADPRFVVNETNAVRPAPVERGAEIVDGETDVVQPGAALRHELADRRLRRARLEQLDQRIARGKAGDRGAVCVVELNLRESEHVAIERTACGEPVDGDSDVRDAGSREPGRRGWGRVLHALSLVHRAAISNTRHASAGQGRETNSCRISSRSPTPTSS